MQTCVCPFRTPKNIRLKHYCGLKKVGRRVAAPLLLAPILSIIISIPFYTMSNPTSIELNSLNFNQPTPVPSRITRPQTDLEAAGQSGSRDEIAVIQVIDAPFDGRMPQDRARFSFDDKNVKDSMKSLPRHEPGTARILDITVHSDFMEEGLRNTQGPQSTQEARDALIDYLSDTYTTTLIESRRIFRWLSDPLLVNDIGSISAQWTQSLSGGGNYLYRLVNRTSLQQHPLDDDVHPRESYLTCAQASNNRLIGECV